MSRPLRRADRPPSSRDQRLFASIQSTLNGGTPSPSPNSRKERHKPKVAEPTEELDDLDAIITQITDLKIRPDRSAIQIKRNLAACGFLRQMGEQEWTEMCKSLIGAALTDGEMDFAVDLFIPLMEYDVFCEVMCTELMTLCSAFVMDGPSGIGNIPAFLGAILCANWPRHMSKAIDTINPVLYTTVSVIKGWILVLEEDNEIAVRAATSVDNIEEGSTSLNESEREDPEIVNRCAHSLCLLCESAQRSLWMKWPELCDEIYAVIKPCITHNQVITGEVKSGLLHTIMTLNSWTRTKAVTMKNSQTQTLAPVTP
ncbi:unnamed protein product [Heligmosomoides polygyrus]|uniref:MIF4G domain-containing protein n=1 Tax=Heligmosomoides polygyrus TaxID=6339 RepID=A0A183GKE8_HELPZ|nr:unnamed protein product [Heligmosomoides polygyrus]